MTASTEPRSKEWFYHFFQHEVTALQEQIECLAGYTRVERGDAVDHCLAGIARLSDEVKDASSYVPAYDQRTYAEALKALSQKLQETREAFQPRAKFSFKTGRKDQPPVSLQDASQLAAKPPQRPVSSSDSSTLPTVAQDPSPLPEPQDMGGPQGSTRNPSFSQSKSVNISNHKSVHIVLPPSASHATSSGSLTSIRNCIVDMSVPTATLRPFASLTLKDIHGSLIICGRTDGPVHVTHMENSVLVVACRQLRMHECKDMDVYLLCTSRPIIEDCHGVRFAPMPGHYINPDDSKLENLWDQVDDFKWIKAEHSPNWSSLPEERRIHDRVWTDVVPGGGGKGVEDILNETVLKDDNT